MFRKPVEVTGFNIRSDKIRNYPNRLEQPLGALQMVVCLEFIVYLSFSILKIRIIIYYFQLNYVQILM